VFAAGSVSVIALSETAVAAADNVRCLCGAWDGRMGITHAGYELPGAGAWLIASTDLRRGTRPVKITVRSAMPDQASASDVLVRAELNELSVAERVGQPASPQAAWREAIFLTTLHGMPAEFPAGPVHCRVSADGLPDGDLDLAVHNSFQGEHAWLAPDQLKAVTAGDIVCHITVNSASVGSQIRAEAERQGFQAHSRQPMNLTLTRHDGVFSRSMDLRSVVQAAVVRGCLPVVQARFDLTQIARKLTNMDSAAEQITSRFAARSCRAVSDSTLALETDTGTQTFDVERYIDASDSDRQRIWRHWEQRT
jgi:hypothetical protein